MNRLRDYVEAAILWICYLTVIVWARVCEVFTVRGRKSEQEKRGGE